MVHEEEAVDVSRATAADLAADMEHHRETYRRLLRVIAYTLIAIFVVLAALFLIYY